MILKKFGTLIRNFQASNYLVRKAVTLCINVGSAGRSLSGKFRVYGHVHLKIEGLVFKVFCEADDSMANDLYYRIDHNANEFKFLAIVSPHLDYFVEIGAFTGIFSIYTSISNKKLKVLAIEPHPKNHKRILKNIALNDITHIDVENVALGEINTTIEFNIPKDEPLATTGSVNAAFAEGFTSLVHEKHLVPQVTLDSIVEKYEVNGLVFFKIDVEYYELNVLKGALKTLSHVKPIILLEVILFERLVFYKPELSNRIDEHYVEKIENLLSDYNYVPYLILKDGIYRTDSVFNNPDNRDFLYIPYVTERRFTPFQEIANLLMKLK